MHAILFQVCIKVRMSVLKRGSVNIQTVTQRDRQRDRKICTWTSASEIQSNVQTKHNYDDSPNASQGHFYKEIVVLNNIILNHQ